MGGSQGGSQQSPAGKVRLPHLLSTSQSSQYQTTQHTYGKETLRPVTIKQLLDAFLPHPEGDFSIDDVEISQVTFVGQIRNISSQATNITYKMDDGTGTIEVKHWVDVDAAPATDAHSNQKLAENEWAHVWGRLKAFSNKRHVGVHVIRPVTDKMEISYHLLEATYVHLYFVRGPPDQSMAKNEGDASGGMYGQQQQQVQNGNSNSGEMVNGKALPAMSVPARRVFQALRSTPQNNEGLHSHLLASTLQMTVPDVTRAADELLSHGVIFTTVDEQTWAVLDF